MIVDDMIDRLRELEPSRLEKESTYSTRIDAEFFWRQLPIYYGYMSGRVGGKGTDYWLSKIISLALGSLDKITREDLDNARKFKFRF